MSKLIDRVKSEIIGEVMSNIELENYMNKNGYTLLETEEEQSESIIKFTNYKSQLWIEYEIDESLVRGLDYYDYAVFEFVTDDENLSESLFFDRSVAVVYVETIFAISLSITSSPISSVTTLKLVSIVIGTPLESSTPCAG